MSSLFDGLDAATTSPRRTPTVRFRHPTEIVRRSAPYTEEPGYSEGARLWLYGNPRLLHGELVCVPESFGPPIHSSRQLDEIERASEELVLASKILVCGVHSPAHMRAAVVPLRWGSPRIVVFSGGFRFHLGQHLKDEPLSCGRLWREGWDSRTDLAISRRSPEKLPTYAHHNPTVDKVIELLAKREWIGLFAQNDVLAPLWSTGS